ncbi:hypothetical protein QEG73_01420 [Chitinophagaceae bacterium 26-R-25]|nr:hypothetical protein [Chitinophagaceae bacterium 26-R-25]
MNDVMFSILAICFVMAIALVGVGENPPSFIELAFRANFKKASKVTWRATSSTYTAKFVLDGVKKYAVYSTRGKLVVIKSAISQSELPVNIMTSFGSEFNGRTVIASFVMTKPDNSRQYLVEGTKVKATYTDDGKLIKVEMKSKNSSTGIKEPIQTLTTLSKPNVL